MILAHLVVGTGGGGAIGLTFRCGDGTIDAARLSAANLAGDGTPVLNFLQVRFGLLVRWWLGYPLNFYYTPMFFSYNYM